MRSLFYLFLAAACYGQTIDAYLHHDFTAGFRYDVKLGQNSYYLGNAPGFAVRYTYRPVRRLALEAGLEQIVHPIGSEVCCRYYRNADDELFLAPFGARFVWEGDGGRARLSLGGGGAYLSHLVGNPDPGGGLNGVSGWGGQVVASGDYGLTESGRLRLGLTGRYYYVGVGYERVARIFTIGPDLTFSFR